MKARASEAGYDRRVSVPSLDMIFDKTPDGRCTVLAPWMDEPFEADTFYECWNEAIRQRAQGPRRNLDAAAE